MTFAVNTIIKRRHNGSTLYADGVTDDTQAFQDLLDGPDDEVLLPRGTIRITKTLFIEGKALVLKGKGINATTIKWAGPADQDAIVIRYPSSGSSVLATMNSSVRDLRIEAETADCTGAGLYLDSLVFFSVQNVHITGFRGSGGCGLRINSESQGGATQDGYLANVHLQSNDIGLVGEDWFQFSLHHVLCNQNLTGQANLIGCSSTMWFGGLIQGTGTYGLRINTGTGFHLAGIHFELDGTAEPFKATGCSSVSVNNSRISYTGPTDGTALLKFEGGCVGWEALNNHYGGLTGTNVAIHATGAVGGVISGHGVHTLTNAQWNCPNAVFLGSQYGGGNPALGRGIGLGAPATAELFQPRAFTVAELNAGGFVGTFGQIVPVSDGDSGAACAAMFDGSSWKRISLGTTVAT